MSISTFPCSLPYSIPSTSTSSDKWIDYLTSLSYPITPIYTSLIPHLSPNFISHLICSKNHLLAVIPSIVSHLSSLSPYTPLNQIHSLLSQSQSKSPSYPLKQSTISLILSKYLWVYQEDNKVLDYLQQKGIQVRVREKRGEIEGLVLVTQGMGEGYGRYGENVGIGWGFVPMRRNGLGRAWYAGIVGGAGKGGQGLIMGIMVVVGSNPEVRAWAVGEWIGVVGKRGYPISIVGEYTKEMEDMLIKFNRKNKTKIALYQNWHYTLQKAQKQYIAQPYKNQLLAVLKKMLLAFNKQQIQLLLKKMQKHLTIKQNRKIAINLLQHTMSPLSQSRLQPRFVGFQIQANKAILILEYIKKMFGYCRGLGIFIYQCLQFERKINTAANRPKKIIKYQAFISKYPKMQKSSQLQDLSTKLYQQIFKKLFYNYYISIHNVSLCPSPLSSPSSPLSLTVLQTLPISPSPSHLNPSTPYTLTYNLTHCHWQCQCNMIYWSGLPCSHLIWVINKYGGDIRYYVSTRWIVRRDNKDPKVGKQIGRIRIENRKNGHEEKFGKEGKENGCSEDTLDKTQKFVQLEDDQ